MVQCDILSEFQMLLFERNKSREMATSQSRDLNVRSENPRLTDLTLDAINGDPSSQSNV